MSMNKMNGSAPSTKIRVAVIVEPDGVGFYAHCPAFEGIHIDGATPEEALKRTHDAVEWYLGSLIRHGEPLPVGPDCEVIDGLPQTHAYAMHTVAPTGAFRKNLDMSWPLACGTS